MKYLFTALIFLGLINQALGQNSIAMESTNIKQNADFNFVKSKKHVRYSEFLGAFSIVKLPKAIYTMHLKVAEFNLKNEHLYTPGEQASYKVVFNEGDYKIETYFNYHGELVQSKESYQNVRIPYSISSKLAKDYPGWAFNTTLCKITYNKSKLPKITYHITMDKGRQKKKVKVSI